MEKFEEVIAELLEVDVVNPTDKLKEFECWDSLTILSIIALADENFSVTLSAKEIVDSETIDGLKKLVSNKK